MESPATSPEEDSSHDHDFLFHLLKEEDLLSYYDVIKNSLQITRLAHFEFVTPADLEKTGLSLPRAKCLLNSAKRMRREKKTRLFISKIVQPVKPLLQSQGMNRGLFLKET